jgi:hypothetical protein
VKKHPRPFSAETGEGTAKGGGRGARIGNIPEGFSRSSRAVFGEENSLTVARVRRQ